IDEVAVPYRLKDAIREPEDQKILHRLFAEIVIDAEDLAFMEDGVDLMVQLARRFEIVAERLLDHDNGDTLLRLRHALRAQVLDDAGEEFRRGGEIEQAVAADLLFLVDAVELGLQTRVAVGVVKVKRKIADVLDELVELRIVLLRVAEFDDAFAHV